jgi:zinc transport system ATP-binding protein
MKQPVIEIENLYFSYNGRPVLKDVSFTVNEGDFLAMIGPNGGGKSTLLKIILGLLEPDKGTVSVLGKSPRKVVNQMGYVPQDVNINRGFPVSVMDVVLMGKLRSHQKSSRPAKEDRAAALQVLKRMEMEAYAGDRIGELSGGQRQKVFIARALAAEPKILLLDEPTANVDTKGQSDFYELLKRLNETVTIVMVNHDMMMLHSSVKSVACVNRDVHYHDDSEITDDMMDMYECPVELVAHGVPHRVLKTH